MFFLRKRRQRMDREAGLVFPWRGSRKHHLGKCLALVVVVSFFVFSVYAIKVDGIKPPPLPKREGVVILLDENNPGCQKLLFQVEQRSPFPMRWDPVFDVGLAAARSEMQESLQGALWQYRAALVPLPESKQPHSLAAITGPQEGLLGEVSGGWQQSGQMPGLVSEVPERGSVSVRAKLVATNGLASRIGVDGVSLPADLVADDWYGQTFRFYVQLAPSGQVVSCVPLMGGTLEAAVVTDRQKNLADWLRRQVFKPGEAGGKGNGFGRLQLQIEALRK